MNLAFPNIDWWTFLPPFFLFPFISLMWILVRYGSSDVFGMLHTLVGRRSIAWSSCDLSKLPRWNLEEQCVAQPGSGEGCQWVAKRLPGKSLLTFHSMNFYWSQSISFAIKSFRDHLWIIMSAMSAKSDRQNANTRSLDVNGKDRFMKQKNTKHHALTQRVSSRAPQPRLQF